MRRILLLFLCSIFLGCATFQRARIEFSYEAGMYVDRMRETHWYAAFYQVKMSMEYAVRREMEISQRTPWWSNVLFWGTIGH